jgi:radical SAM/Cys-rich protein
MARTERANRFERAVSPRGSQGLRSVDLTTIQVNVGLRCNQHCAHCHLDASPGRAEAMDWPLMQQVVQMVRSSGCQLVDITGGAPELSPHLRGLIAALRELDAIVQVRTNLTVLLEPGVEHLPEFYRDHRVRLVGSLPCYLEENVTAQRGPAAYAKSIEAIRRLNHLGYGRRPDLPLNLVYNPVGPALPPPQDELEADYRRELGGRFGIEFTRLLTITNMPIGRFLAALRGAGGEQNYLRLLQDAWNSATVDGLMCRHQVSVGWDGTLYDCDFNLALGLAVDHGAPACVADFGLGALAGRRIVTGDHCFGCTAGQGSSCAGALA